MRKWLAEHSFLIVVMVLLLLPIVFMIVQSQGRNTNPTLARRLSVGVASTAQQGMNSVFGGFRSFFSNYILLVNTNKENQRLVEENERLVGEVVVAKNLAVENAELRTLLGLGEARRDMEMAAGVVISRELTPFYRVARIVVKLDGDAELKKDQAVMAHLGLVGRVVAAANKTGDVMLLTDGRSRVAAEVLGRGILGMLIGAGRQDESMARLQVGVNEPLLENGAVVTTSGHDQVFPRGVEIGYITNAEKSLQAGPFREYDVSLSVNPGSLSHVMVVTEIKKDISPAR